MIEDGILPIDDPSMDMRVPLRALPPQDARVRKRKFRKVWRRLARTSQSRERQLGLGKANPSRSEKLERKRMVLDDTMQRVVAPAVASLTRRDP